jgi:hypothetical protein
LTQQFWVIYPKKLKTYVHAGILKVALFIVAKK